jgi:glycine betaine/choline ABC-type transport system substrate-binding protein
MRTYRKLALGATVLVAALVAAACSSGGGSGSSSSTSPAASGPSLASTFVFGAPPDCATNKFCGIGLKSVYGIQFQEIKTTDFGGPVTVAALKSGAIQVGELFSTSVYDPDFVVLNDDKHLEAADNITAVVRTAVATTDVQSALNAVDSKLTTAGMLALNKQVDIDQQDVSTVAKAFLEQNGLLGTPTTTGAGKTLTVGVSASFSESKLVAEMYAEVLENAGYTVKRDFNLGSRKVSDTALFSGKIDIKPEYLASEAVALDPNAAVSGDTQNNLQVLTPLEQAKGVTVLTPSAAIDTNVFVVTKATAAKYNLSNVSDLAKPVG